MLLSTYLACLFFCTSLLFAQTPLQIHIYTDFNGHGLETDQRVLKASIEQWGHEVTSFHWDAPNTHPADINIFFQRIPTEKIPRAKRNWFISNPECYIQDPSLLKSMDLILCRTQESMRIFHGLNNLFFLGFTSPDAYRQEIPKDFSRFVHLPGGATFQKNTAAITNLWKHNKRLPSLTLTDWSGSLISQQDNLTVIPYRLPLEEFRLLQNCCGIHLCPSVTEGYGHYIMEAMSTGAVVLTTNGAPMNEFISDSRFLIPCKTLRSYNLGVSYEIIHSLMKDKIIAISRMSPQELKVIGLKNRAIYLQMTQEFHERLKELLDTTVAELEQETLSPLKEMI